MYEDLQPLFSIFKSGARSMSRSKGAKCNISTSVNHTFWDIVVQYNYWKEYLADIWQIASQSCTERKTNKKKNVLYFQNKQPKAFLNFGGSKRNAVGRITCFNFLKKEMKAYMSGSAGNMVFHSVSILLQSY